MKTAFLFPGQASQKVGMGLDLYNETEIGKQYFEMANEMMGVDLKSIIFNGPEEKLTETQYTQPAIYLVSVILGKLLQDNGLRSDAVAGHSLGEYSALTFADAFDFESGIELVKLRAESMQNAGTIMPGTMAAIIGLEENFIDEICDNYNQGIVVSANYNAPGQVVISGETQAVKDVMNLAKEAGARMTIELNVSGAFHSPLMTSAKEALTEKLESIKINDIDIPVYSNVSAKPVTKSDEIRDNLIAQLDNTVLWQNIILNMIDNKIAKFIEVGPGKVLQGLTKRINRNVISAGIESNNDVNSYLHE